MAQDRGESARRAMALGVLRDNWTVDAPNRFAPPSPNEPPPADDPSRLQPSVDPFAPRQPASGGQLPKGCGAIALGGCALVFVLLGVGGILLALNAEKFLSWSFGMIADQLETKLADDVDPDLRARFSQAIDDFAIAVAAGKVAPDVLSDIQQRLVELTRVPRISADLARSLAEELEEVARGAGPLRDDTPDASDPPPTSTDETPDEAGGDGD